MARVRFGLPGCIFPPGRRKGRGRPGRAQPRVQGPTSSRDRPWGRHLLLEAQPQWWGACPPPQLRTLAGPLQGPGSRDSRRPFAHSQGVPPGGGGADPSTAGPGVSLDGAPPEPRAGLVWGCSTRYLVND